MPPFEELTWDDSVDAGRWITEFYKSRSGRSTPGAVVAVTLWVASTLLLRVYQKYSSSSQMIYGGLNAVATLLLWFYLMGAAIFIGGEVNSEIEKAAAEANHPDVREAGERRSGGEGSGAL